MSRVARSSFFWAQDVSAVASESAVARSTVEGYGSILEDTLLTWRLPAFEKRPRIRERAHPKIYWIDAGIVRSLKGARGPVLPEERGTLLEGWVANTLRATFSYESAHVQMSYFPRHESYGEVDFILRDGDEIVAIEVKASGNVDSQTLKGLRTIRDLEGLKRRILVCGVTLSEKTEDGIEIWPFTRFAAESNRAELFG